MSSGIQKVVRADNLLFGIAGGFGAEIVAPGHVHHNGMEAINLAELSGGITRTARAGRCCLARGRLHRQPVRRSLAGGVEQAGRERRVQRDLHGDRHAGRPGLRQRRAWGIACACVEEAVAVASAKGVELAYDDPVRWVRDFAGKIPNAPPSMYQDVRAGRRSEIDSIQGGVVAEGAKLGVPTPTCALMVQLVKALEAKARTHGNAYEAL